MDGTDINSLNGQNMPTPSADATQTAPEISQPAMEPMQPEMRPQFRMPMRLDRRTMLIGAVIIILIAAGLYLYGTGIPTGNTTTILTGSGILTECTAISVPGNYTIGSKIKTTIQSGACIIITASHVNLACSGNGQIAGSGPYSGVPPFTYGIGISGASNVSISGCSIKNFSYGIYASSSSRLAIHDNNVSTNYLSNIYLNGTNDSNVYANFMAGSASIKGSLYLGNGSSGNRVYNNTILRNQYYGINVNSSGNTFLNNYLNSTPVSFYCGIGNGFKDSNIGVSNLCFNSTGCGFMSCRGTNIPVDLSQLQLNNSISGCGSISQPGLYALKNSVNMGTLVNVTAEQQYGVPCISIKSSDVSLNCNNLGVYNSTTGIAAFNSSNVTISNCNVWSSHSGITFVSTMASKVTNATMRNDSIGMMFLNSSGETVSNVKANSGTYGLYLSNSSSDTFQIFNFSNNQYGIYVNDSIGETFSNGAAINNHQFDVYATPDSANSSYSLMLSSTCTLSNAQWATCTQHVNANLTNVPISACGDLTRPGTYKLTTNIINAPPMCVEVQTNNVLLDCLSHSITAAQYINGPAFYFNGRDNVSIKNCTTFNFVTGVAAYNSSNVVIANDITNNGNYGIALYNVNHGTVINNRVAGTVNASIYLANVRNSDISFNNATYGRLRSVGILLNNSNDNRVLNNTLFTNYIGISFMGSSRDNLVNNNTALFSAVSDYSCNSISGGFAANLGGIDYGTVKQGCRWLAALTKGSAQVPCSSMRQSEQMMLSGDGLYGFNATCFSVYSPDSRIDCNGHTIIATNNGTFVDFENSHNPQLLNCFLKGFTSPIVAVNSSPVILNNTIRVNGTGAGITVLNSLLPNVKNNNITYSHGAIGLYGMLIADSSSGYLLNNMVSSANTAYWLDNVSSFVIRNNTATKNDIVGMYLSKSQSNQFYENNFTSSATGIDCELQSQGNLSNVDNGGLVCKSSIGCMWIRSSILTCHS